MLIPPFYVFSSFFKGLDIFTLFQKIINNSTWISFFLLILILNSNEIYQNINQLTNHFHVLIFTQC